MEPAGNDELPVAQPTNSYKKLILGLVAAGLVTLLILIGGVFLAFGYIRQTIQSTSLNLPLLTDRPVKNSIAFVGNDDNLWLVSPNGENQRKITDDGRGYRFPTWSPDGRQLAFVGPAAGDNPALYVSPTYNSEPVVLFNNPDAAPFYLYWAPNSHSITFLTQESSGLAMRQIETRTSASSRTLATGSPFYWAWAPSSDKMLMHVGGSRAASNEAHISILENQADAERIQLDLAPGRFQAPVWSSDGKYFYYIAADSTLNESIYKTDAGSLEQTKITNLGGTAHLALSPDNRHLAYLQFEPRLPAPFGRAYLVETNGQNHQRLVSDPIASLYWSPDGRKLALLGLSRGADGPTAQKIDGLAAPLAQELNLRWWIYDVETETLEPLFSFTPTSQFLQTVPFFDQYHLSLTFWSPDSRYFVVTEKQPDGRGQGQVWVVDTTGQEEPRQVGEGTLAVWSWQ